MHFNFLEEQFLNEKKDLRNEIESRLEYEIFKLNNYKNYFYFETTSSDGDPEIVEIIVYISSLNIYRTYSELLFTDEYEESREFFRLRQKLKILFDLQKITMEDYLNYLNELRRLF